MRASRPLENHEHPACGHRGRVGGGASPALQVQERQKALPARGRDARDKPIGLRQQVSGVPVAWRKRLSLAMAGALAALLGGCMSMPERLASWQGEPGERSPSGRIMQSDVDALNDAVSAIARTEDPKRHEEASKKLAALLPRFQAAREDALAAQTLFWLAYCYEKTGRKDDAVVFYEQVLRKYPDSRVAEQARSRRDEIKASRQPVPPP